MGNSKSERTEISKFSKYQIFVVALLTVLQFTVVFGFAIMSPLGDILMKGLEIDTAQFGLLISSYAFGAGISGILVATIADKFDRKKFLLVFYAGYLIGMLLCGLANTYTLLLIARCISGIFGGVIASISFSIISDLFSLDQRGRVMGYMQMGFSASQILGIPVGLLFANAWGWNSTFLFIAAIGIIIGLLILFKLKPITEHKVLQDENNILKRFWQVLANKQYLIGYLLITLTSTGGGLLMPFSASFLINNVGLTQEQLPLVFLCTGIFTVFIMPLTGKLSDHYSKYKVFLVGSIIGMVMTMIYTNLSPAPLWIVIAVNILMFVGVSSRTVPVTALNTAIPIAKDRGAYLSLCSSLQQMSNGIGAMIAGLIVIQQTPSSPLQHFPALGLVTVATIILSIFLVRKVAKTVSENSSK